MGREVTEATDETEGELAVWVCEVILVAVVAELSCDEALDTVAVLEDNTLVV